MRTVTYSLCLLALAGCATAPVPDLDRLHTDLTAKEGTAHYDEWSPDAQAEWNSAWKAVMGDSL